MIHKVCYLPHLNPLTGVSYNSSFLPSPNNSTALPNEEETNAVEMPDTQTVHCGMFYPPVKDISHWANP